MKLLEAVWTVEFFKYYPYGRPFQVITDLRALLSIMSKHQSNKFYDNRLALCFDRLLPFDFAIDQHLGSKKVLVDYISCNLQENQQVIFSKFHFAKQETEWAGHKIMSLGLTTFYKKVKAIQASKSPENLKKLYILLLDQSSKLENSHRICLKLILDHF